MQTAKIMTVVLSAIIICSCSRPEKVRTEAPLVLSKQSEAQALHASDIREDLIEQDYVIEKNRGKLKQLQEHLNELEDEIEELKPEVDAWERKKAELPRREGYRYSYTVRRMQNQLKVLHDQQAAVERRIDAMEKQIRNLELTQRNRRIEAREWEKRARETRDRAEEQERRPRHEKEVWDLW